MKQWLILSMIASACVTTACGGDDGDDDDGTAVELDCKTNAPTYDDVSAIDKCVMCHNSELSGTKRNGAPGNINFDMPATAKAAAGEAVKMLQKGEMPPKTSKITVTDAEKQKFYDWVECGSLE